MMHRYLKILRTILLLTSAVLLPIALTSNAFSTSSAQGFSGCRSNKLVRYWLGATLEGCGEVANICADACEGKCEYDFYLALKQSNPAVAAGMADRYGEIKKKADQALKRAQDMGVNCFSPGPGECGKGSKDFHIVIQRNSLEHRNGTKDGKPVEGTLVKGIISVNGEQIGEAFENDDLKIPAGTYKGLLRYVSPKGFAQGPFGTYAKTGDFLIEVGNVNKRINILFHGGTQPWHSEGCILLGPISKSGGVKSVAEGQPLQKLRMLFYENETPDSTPDKDITIEIVDNISS